jgi:hypothetical protein
LSNWRLLRVNHRMVLGGGQKVHIPVQFVHRFRGKSSTHSD